MRLPAPIRATHGSGERRSRGDGGTEESSGSGRLRQALLAALLVGFAYLAWRRVRSGAPGTGPDAAAPGGEPPEEGHPVPIDGPTDEGPGGDGSVDERTGPGEEPPDDEEYGTASAVDPSLEEVDERVEEDVEGTPAEPGEVSVSEDVAEAAGDEPEAAEEEGDGAEDEPDAAGDGPDERGGDAAEGSTDDADAGDTDESDG